MTITATSPSGAAGASSATAASAAASASAGSIVGNFSTFLTLLTTQMKNQDPTSPLDTNQFTSQLVQFASVEQQINANTNLQTLISLGSASALSQAAAMVGHTVLVEAEQMPLQNGSGGLQYTLANAQNVDISVLNSSGVELYRTTVAGSQGANTWRWNGKSASGLTQPDGAYAVKVSASDGAKSAVSFAVLGTATGVVTSGGAPSLNFGQLTVPISAVRSVID